MISIKKLDGIWQIASFEDGCTYWDASTIWANTYVPGVWNIDDPSLTGEKVYRKCFDLDEKKSKSHYFLRFEGVGGYCSAYLNHRWIGEHKGGYSAFAFDATEAILSGENELVVVTDNTRKGDIIPLTGDFNNYGGIYRQVSLSVSGKAFFDMSFYGTYGLEVDTYPDGLVRLFPHVGGETEGVMVSYRLFSPNGSLICDQNGTPNSESVLKVTDPQLWDGRNDPKLYKICARLLLNNDSLDEVELYCGFREIRVDADTGFYLNGKHLKLKGVAKHQDRSGYGCAVPAHLIREDFEMIYEIGANSVRLSHYQHPQMAYDCCDRLGLVAWAEIPLLSAPDDNETVMENAEQQLKELIYQNKHHPSVCFWGVQNEVTLGYDSPCIPDKIRRVDALARSLDPTRFSASANQTIPEDSPLNGITQVTGQNRYYGWYYGELCELGEELDALHKRIPNMPLSVTEYGVDAYEGYHTADPKRRDYSEEYQCVFHESTYEEIAQREWLWGSYVWNMFDFGSSRRNEGGLSGLNRKGMVSFDRTLKKDVYYFYKAKWSDEPFVYITSKRFACRAAGFMKVKVYTNVDEDAILFLNGKEICRKKGDVVLFDDVPVCVGDFEIVVKAGDYEDRATFVGIDAEKTDTAFIDPNPGFHVKDWYTPEEGKSELFPPDRYSLMDTIAVLYENEEAWSLVDEYLPQISRNERMMGFKRIQLMRAVNMISGQLEESTVKLLNSKLRQIVK